MWRLVPPKFYNQDYQHCLALIDKMYSVNCKSLAHTVSWTKVQQDCEHLVTDMHPLFSFGGIPFLSTSIFPSMTLIGFVGRIRAPTRHGEETGIIIFRGTTDVSEWLQNINVIHQTDLSSLGSVSSTESVIHEQPLLDVDSKRIPRGTKISQGMARLYTSLSGKKVTSDHGACYCSDACQPSTFSTLFLRRVTPQCTLIPTSRVSKIQGSCSHTTGITVPCGPSHGNRLSTSLTSSTKKKSYGPSLQEMIFEAVKSLEKKYPTMKQWVIAGHSLGGAMATLCSYHLTKTSRRVLAVYSIASPRLGNPQFVHDYNRHVVHHYRVANIDDLVPQLPLPFMSLTKKQSIENICYCHVANTDYTFSDPAFVQKLCTCKSLTQSCAKIHSCQLYRLFRYPRTHQRLTE